MCECGSTRTIEVWMKHNDLASINIPHMNVDIDGYMPTIGPFAGDDTSIEICLDCGKVQDWEPITDADIKNSEWYGQHEARMLELEAEALEEEAARKREIAADRDPQVIDFVALQTKQIEQLLKQAFGPYWEREDEAKEILEGELESAEGPRLKAIQGILKRLS